jgi:FXSXX-COOH protein
VAKDALVVSPEESVGERVLDTRAIPLDELAADSGVRRMVDRIVGSTEESSRLPVAAFNSAI